MCDPLIPVGICLCGNTQRDESTDHVIAVPVGRTTLIEGFNSV
jgi:hypothetical protein